MASSGTHRCIIGKLQDESSGLRHEFHAVSDLSASSIFAIVCGAAQRIWVDELWLVISHRGRWQPDECSRSVQVGSLTVDTTDNLEICPFLDVDHIPLNPRKQRSDLVELVTFCQRYRGGGSPDLGSPRNQA